MGIRASIIMDKVFVGDKTYVTYIYYVAYANIHLKCRTVFILKCLASCRTDFIAKWEIEVMEGGIRWYQNGWSRHRDGIKWGWLERRSLPGFVNAGNLIQNRVILTPLGAAHFILKKVLEQQMYSSWFHLDFN